MEKKVKKPTSKGPESTFTGEVWHDALAEAGNGSRLQVGLVRFSPGARSAWHSHANGQTLHVTDGIGYVAALGEEPVLVRMGDTVYAPPGEVHWHGATRHDSFAHLSITEALAPGQEGPVTDWGAHVTDDEYPA